MSGDGAGCIGSSLGSSVFAGCRLCHNPGCTSCHAFHRYFRTRHFPARCRLADSRFRPLRNCRGRSAFPYTCQHFGPFARALGRLDGSARKFQLLLDNLDPLLRGLDLCTCFLHSQRGTRGLCRSGGHRGILVHWSLSIAHTGSKCHRFANRWHAALQHQPSSGFHAQKKPRLRAGLFSSSVVPRSINKHGCCTPAMDIKSFAGWCVGPVRGPAD